MDLDTRAINAFLRLKQAQIHAFLSSGQLTHKVFHTRTAEFKYLRLFASKHGQMPSRALFIRKFPSFPSVKVKDKFEALSEELMHRAQQNALVELVNELGSDDAINQDLDACIQKLQQTIIQVGQHDPQAHDHEYVSSYARRMQEYQDRKNNLGNLTFSTGCQSMDNTLGGGVFAPQLMVLAGDPKMGKTWWLCNMMLACYRAGKVPMLISPEMDEAEIMQRVDCMRFKLPHQLVRTGKLTPKQERRWANAAKADKIPLHIIDTTNDMSFTPSKLLGKIELYKPNIVFIDSAYYMVADGIDPKQRGYQDNFALVKQLKGVCKAKGIPMVCVVQMKPDTERSGLQGEAALRGVYGGDHWAQGCDVMLRLTGARADQFRKLILLANREGETFKETYIKYDFDPYPQVYSVEEVVAEEADGEDAFMEVEA